MGTSWLIKTKLNILRRAILINFEKMFEVRSSENGLILGWLPPPRYPDALYNNFYVTERFSPPYAFPYSMQFPAPSMSVAKIQFEVSIVYDPSENYKSPYVWKIYKCDTRHVTIEMLRKIRGFVENRSVDYYETMEQDFRLQQMMRLLNPPMLCNFNGDIENLNIMPGGVVYIKDIKDRVDMKETIRKEFASRSNSKPEDKLLLLCGNQ